MTQMSTNPNVNCLEHMRCPNPTCGSYGPFRIRAGVSVTVADDGTDDDGEDYEWETAAPCRCLSCQHSATVADFTEKA